MDVTKTVGHSAAQQNGHLSRVAIDLENLEKSGNLKDTSESQGICLKSQGICNKFPKLREKSGNLLSEINFQPS